MLNKVSWGGVKKFYRACFSQGLRVSTHPDFIPTAARTLREEGEPFGVRVKQERLPVIEEGLRTLVRWHQFATAFSSKVATINSAGELHSLLSGEILRPRLYGKIWQKERIISLEEACFYVSAFLRACMGQPFETKNDPRRIPVFYALGPCVDLPVGSADCLTTKTASFPEINIAAGELYFIQPVPDNLVGLQFRILDREERIIKRYAFDLSRPGLFSAYDYAEEEERQFRIFNPHLFTPEGQQIFNRLREFFIEYQQLRYSLGRFHRNCQAKIIIPELEFEIAGPLRDLLIKTPNLNPQAGEEKKEVTAAIFHLNLEAGKLYRIKIYYGNFPNSKKKTVVAEVWLLEADRRKSAFYYFMGPQNAFIPVHSAVLDRSGRLQLPHHLAPKPWDGEARTRLVF